MNDLRVLFAPADPGYRAHLAYGDQPGVEVPFTPFLAEDDSAGISARGTFPLSVAISEGRIGWERQAVDEWREATVATKGRRG